MSRLDDRGGAGGAVDSEDEVHRTITQRVGLKEPRRASLSEVDLGRRDSGGHGAPRMHRASERALNEEILADSRKGVTLEV